jgi:hypothetical protein
MPDGLKWCLNESDKVELKVLCNGLLWHQLLLFLNRTVLYMRSNLLYLTIITERGAYAIRNPMGRRRT